MTYLTDKQTEINDLLNKMRELTNEDPRCVSEIHTEKARGIFFPEGVFKNILSYCDDTIEEKQKKNMKQLVSDFDKIFKVRNEDGIDTKEWIVDGEKFDIDSLFANKWWIYKGVKEFDTDYAYTFRYILFNPSRLDIKGFQQSHWRMTELRTVIQFEDGPTIKSYTKNGENTADEREHFNRMGWEDLFGDFTKLSFNVCTNY
jgi:hypothetical protein